MPERAPIERTPLTEPLDAFLREIVQTLHAAVNQGLQSARDNPTVADKSIADCAEILDVIMAGHVREWVA